MGKSKPAAWAIAVRGTHTYYLFSPILELHQIDQELK